MEKGYQRKADRVRSEFWRFIEFSATIKIRKRFKHLTSEANNLDEEIN
jgi:hypothetical protein